MRETYNIGRGYSNQQTGTAMEPNFPKGKNQLVKEFE
jgi:hypothetical protein